MYVYGINNQDLKALIKTLQLPIILTKEFQYADSILALASLVKNNRKLRQISQAKKITIHTIQSNNILNIAKALRGLVKKTLPAPTKKENITSEFVELLSREFLTPLEEARLIIEEIVIPQNIAVDLFPRTSQIRKQQHELISHYQLKGLTIGQNKNKRLRILPNNISS